MEGTKRVPGDVRAQLPAAPPKQPLSIGLVGLGTISKYYLAALADGITARLDAVADIHAEALATLPNGIATTLDYRELLEMPLDAVVVTVPNDLHYEICDAALRAGKHVCCEKPLADPSAAAQLEALAAERGLVLFTAFHRRYNASLRRLAALAPDARAAFLEYSERIEDHCGKDLWYLDPARCGGGCLADNGPNAFDMLDSILGRPRVISARVLSDANGVDVRAEVHLECGERAIPAQVLLDWTYPFGERKELMLQLSNGLVARADLLGKWAGFKASLFHEYVAVVDDFIAAIADGSRRGGDGLAIAQLVADAYVAARSHSVTVPDTRDNPGVEDKVGGPARLIKVLRHVRHDRGMTLLPLESRCIQRGEIHEIVTTDEVNVRAGQRVDRVSFVGFAEFLQPAVVERGDSVVVGTTVGRVLGFDGCHYPNHYNILIAVRELRPSSELGVRVGDVINFLPPSQRGDAPG